MKGMDGARMQDIANETGINKAFTSLLLPK
jgi:hypothetical protein